MYMASFIEVKVKNTVNFTIKSTSHISDSVGFVESKASDADQLNLEGYSFIRETVRRRESKVIYGGAALFAKCNIAKEIEVIHNPCREFIWVKLKRNLFNSDKDIYLCLCHISPKKSTFFLRVTMAVFQSKNLLNKILQDFPLRERH